RFRVDSFVAAAEPSRPPIVLERGHRAAPPAPTPEALVEAARPGGRYLLAHQSPDGAFEYEYYPLVDQAVGAGPGYSLPRHAGATSFLARLAGETRDPAFRDAARRALGFLAGQHPPGCDRPDLTCVGAPGDDTVDLGAAAMSLIATLDYKRATGSDEFFLWSSRLANFLLAMQKLDGDFCHL